MSPILREIEISLPYELDQKQQEALALSLAKDICITHGVAVQISIHKPHKNHNEKNVHAHIIFSTRKIDHSGFTQKTREWDDIKTGKQVVKAWRKKWEELANHELSKNQNLSPIDCRSYADQGLDIEPTQHMGSFASELEKRGIKSRIGNKNRQIKYRNRLRLELKRNRKPNELSTPKNNLKIQRKASLLEPKM